MLDQFNGKYFLIWLNMVFGVLFLYLFGLAFTLYGLLGLNVLLITVSCISFKSGGKNTACQSKVQEEIYHDEIVSKPILRIPADNASNQEEIRWLMSSAD